MAFISKEKVFSKRWFINNIDPRAFVTIINSNEIPGEGLKSLQGKLDRRKES